MLQSSNVNMRRVENKYHLPKKSRRTGSGSLVTSQERLSGRISMEILRRRSTIASRPPPFARTGTNPFRLKPKKTNIMKIISRGNTPDQSPDVFIGQQLTCKACGWLVELTEEDRSSIENHPRMRGRGLVAHLSCPECKADIRQIIMRPSNSAWRTPHVVPSGKRPSKIDYILKQAGADPTLSVYDLVKWAKRTQAHAATIALISLWIKRLEDWEQTAALGRVNVEDSRTEFQKMVAELRNFIQS